MTVYSVHGLFIMFDPHKHPWQKILFICPILEPKETEVREAG